MVMAPLLRGDERDSGLDDPMSRRQMEAMPRPDPVPPKRRPPDYRRAEEAWARYKAMMKWMAVLAAVCVLLSLIYLKSFGDSVPIHMVIATVAGVGLTVLLGTGLMGLLFLSNRSGHDDEANRSDWDEE
jgi:hypothetical protein